MAAYAWTDMTDYATGGASSQRVFPTRTGSRFADGPLFLLPQWHETPGKKVGARDDSTVSGLLRTEKGGHWPPFFIAGRTMCMRWLRGRNVAG